MNYLSDALLAAGAAAISIGIGCIYWPAGIIAAGLFLMTVGGLYAYITARNDQRAFKATHRAA